VTKQVVVTASSVGVDKPVTTRQWEIAPETSHQRGRQWPIDKTQGFQNMAGTGN
jgi:hypothetical protein